MNICIIGDGLTSLSLAKNLINKKINIHIYYKNKINKLALGRTIGIAKNNFKFFEKKIDIIKKKSFWPIKKIEIYSEKLENNKILNFGEDNSILFYMVKNNELYESLNNKLLKNKLFKKKLIKNNFYEDILNTKKYDLIINCDPNNFITKRYFSKNIVKDYYNQAFTTILKHEELENNTAIQIFTELGPIAFLPVSKMETSVVFSVEFKNYNIDEQVILALIKKHNPKFKIKKMSKLKFFKLKLSNLRNYHNKNILAFGDILHKVHPLAGQGFNMTIRDIKILSEIIQNKIDLGIQLDALIFEEFEKKTKHSNFIFSNGIDFIYEFFNFDKKNKAKNITKILKYIGRNQKISNALIKLADKGLNFSNY